MLHHWIPEAGPADAKPAGADARILALAIDQRDALGAMLAWTLAVEFSGRDTPVTLLAPVPGRGHPAWPHAGGDHGRARFVPCDTRDPCVLLRDANSLARTRAAHWVFAALPPPWLSQPSPAGQLTHILLLVVPGRTGEAVARERIAAALRLGVERVSTLVVGAAPDQGLELHRGLATASDQVDPTPAGIIPDHLDLYRSIAARLPVLGEGAAAAAVRQAADRLLAGAGKPPRAGSGIGPS